MKHTIGNWEVSNGRRILGDGFYVDTEKELVAYCGSKNKAEANARLIASAPELLDCLKEALEWLPELGVHNNSPTLNKFKQAIAKAEGNQ
jgi:hypothetical protein